MQASPGGVNIGARLLSGKPARIGWWKSSDDPHSDSTLFDDLKTDTSTTTPTSAADHRVLLSSGPYSLDVGDSLTFSIAIVAGNGTNAVLSASQAAAEKYREITPVREKRDPNGILPTRFELRQNFPNPFNPSTTISFDLPSTTHVKVCVYNVLGQLVATLLEGQKAAGRYSVVWNAGSLASGIYFCRIESNSFTRTMKMVLMK
ncbi:MAG: T9SS type A sorting domain-containing protein [Bacteroidetes bacterium]|nr:T9SS type A sorting domain-containing protein [Bacteroidota bacterium]